MEPLPVEVQAPEASAAGSVPAAGTSSPPDPAPMPNQPRIAEGTDGASGQTVSGATPPTKPAFEGGARRTSVPTGLACVVSYSYVPHR